MNTDKVSGSMKQQILFIQGGGAGAHKADESLVSYLRRAWLGLESPDPARPFRVWRGRSLLPRLSSDGCAGSLL